MAVKRVSQAEVSRYGVIDSECIVERVHRVIGLKEKPNVEESP